MLQHASINTFVKHYSVGIHVDAQAIVRGLPAQKAVDEVRSFYEPVNRPSTTVQARRHQLRQQGSACTFFTEARSGEKAILEQEEGGF